MDQEAILKITEQDWAQFDLGHIDALQKRLKAAKKIRTENNKNLTVTVSGKSISFTEDDDWGKRLRDSLDLFKANHLTQAQKILQNYIATGPIYNRDKSGKLSTERRNNANTLLKIIIEAEESTREP